MSVTIISHGGSDRAIEYPERSRASSGGSASVRSPVHSPASSDGSRSYSGSAGSGESWTHLSGEEEDDIEPSDSASRSRQSSSRRHTTEVRPVPTRRHSSRRIREPEEPPPPPRRRRSSHRHHSNRHRRVDSHRVPSDESSSTVASHDDYPRSHHGAPYPPYPPQSGYRHVPEQSRGGYPPSIVTSAPAYPNPYGPGAMVHVPQTDEFGYPSSNPFSPQGPQQNPFSPMSTASGSSYFATDPHAPPMQHHARPPAMPRPQSYAPSSAYGSEVMSPYGHPAMPHYPGYMMPGMAGMQGMSGMPGMPGVPNMPGMPGMPGYPMPGMPGWYPPPSNHSSTAPPSAKEDKSEEKERDAGIARLELIIQKQEEARLAREKEMIAQREAEVAAAAAKEAKAEEEKKKKEEIAAASKKAKEDAEKKAEDAAKKAKEEHEKKLKEVQALREEAEKKQKELEETTKKLTPAPDTTKAPIKFKDAVGRKFSFPFHLCRTWKGMEGLIKQAFIHVDVIGEHVIQGHYDLLGPDGEIILPQVWETMIQPDWEISMHMWPMPEEKEEEKKKDKLAKEAAALGNPFASLDLGGLGDLGIVDPGKKKKKDGSKKKKSGDQAIIDVPMMGPGGMPPPPAFPPGILPDPLGGMGMAMFPPGISPVEDNKRDKGKASKGKTPSVKGKDVPGFASWFAGASNSRPSKKDDEKLDLVRRRTNNSGRSGSNNKSADQAACAVM